MPMVMAASVAVVMMTVHGRSGVEGKDDAVMIKKRMCSPSELNVARV